MGFKLIKKGEVQYYIDEKIDSAGGLSHIFTTRKGGFSKGSLSSMNMSPTKEDVDTVIENYRTVCHCEDIDAESCVLSHQTHTDNVRIVTREDAGKRLFRESDIFDTDGLITNVKGLPIVIFFADCVPVLLYDHVKKVVATVHAGWRGTVADIAGKAVDKMVIHFGSKPKDILAAIGPSIDKCCFETGDETREEFEKAGLGQFISGRFIDLQESNKFFLTCHDVEPKNITISGLCTKCNTDMFFSHRGLGADTGRMALIASLK
ncbi:MAG: peptidoglycan editing factor PgeF [Monoglobales bacterium]